MRCSTRWMAVAWAVLAIGVGERALAQRADVPIEPERGSSLLKESAAELKRLREAGKAISPEQAKKPQPATLTKPIVLPSPSAARLEPPAIAERARKSMLRVGWHYLCHKCDDWHTNLAGGYIVAEGGIGVTCEHVVSPDAGMKEGYLVAQDTSGRFYPVTALLATDAEMDVAIFRIESGDALPPLPMNDQVGPGDAAYLLSDPKGHTGYFSAGMVNRFYWGKSKAGDANRLEDVRRLRINVSTDWAPGSSGAAVLDACGNAIAHVSRIETEVAQVRAAPPADDPATKPARPARTPAAGGTQIVFHEGIPVRGVKLLIAQLNARETATDKKPAAE